MIKLLQGAKPAFGSSPFLSLIPPFLLVFYAKNMQKMLKKRKMHFSTSVIGAQHPNAGQIYNNHLTLKVKAVEHVP